jgi:outer membrane protein OmpA-like peptidoglycan-associated protein
MSTRTLGLLGLLVSLSPVACAKAHGPFGYSRHPYTHAQIQALLGNWPNPGPNVDDVVRDLSGAPVDPPRDPAAYAMELVVFEPGRPAAIIEASNPREALGMPNYSANIWEPPHAVSLGNGGAIVFKLVGDPLVDLPGPDLFVFESGPSREAVSVEISFDGETWISVGDAPGGATAIDIGPYVSPSEVFRYVRLRDVVNSGGDSDPWPGAEIDAVAARRGWPAPVAEKPKERIAISTEVLFGFDSDALGSGAPAALDRVVTRMQDQPALRLAIEGHTDDIGEADYNLALSERRAQAVRAYLLARGIAADRVSARGFGEARPIAPNDGDEGRRKNRRVELVLEER